MIEITRNDDGTYDIAQVKQSNRICDSRCWDDGTGGCGIPERNANDIGNHDGQFGDPELTQYKGAERDMAKNVFGVCPTCNKTDGYANAGKMHIFFCIEHRVRWTVGANLFSSWREQSEDEQRHIYDTVGLGDFTEIEPYMIEEARDLPFCRAFLYALPEA